MYNVLEKLRTEPGLRHYNTTAQHSTAQHSTAQHSTAQHSTAQHSTAQHSTAQHSTAQHSTAQLSEHDLHVYNAGLIGILRQLHDELDRAVFDAYGWPHNLTTEQILERIVALNAERRAEEASGLIRWLRPEYQSPNYVPTTATLAGFIEEAPITRRKQTWPTAIPDQFRVIKEAMRSTSPQTPQQIASAFRPAPRTRVAEILATLTALGQARESAGRYSL